MEKSCSTCNHFDGAVAPICTAPLPTYLVAYIAESPDDITLAQGFETTGGTPDTYGSECEAWKERE